ncbi:MAG TPA: hypothetical protein VFJ97_06700, partial [Dermatophilaceae bacterium]|nr:hypothetical protein [Dermatophilaceae bacterium]
LAGPDEVLVSSTVKDLVAGSGISFLNRGDHELKGVPDEWRLYQVTAVSAPPSNQVVDDVRERRATDRVLTTAARRAPSLVGRMLNARDRTRRPG